MVRTDANVADTDVRILQESTDQASVMKMQTDNYQFTGDIKDADAEGGLLGIIVVVLVILIAGAGVAFCYFKKALCFKEKA